ncbi:MAG: hypothetical protein COA99_00040 [Moraxellaceae bacterium]|nr:MAG: hypothetical protein COA99_00040 [Moraxellaceae bacterium]
MKIFSSSSSVKTYQPRQAGLSLLELMIALALSSFLLLGVFQIFNANITSSNLQRAYSRVQENGRIATELIARDIRMTGYWGCKSAAITKAITDAKSPAEAELEAGKFIAIQLDTNDGDFSKEIIPTGTGSITGTDNTTNLKFDSIDVIAGSDILTLKGFIGIPGVKIDSAMVTKADPIQIQGNADIPQGMLMLIADCAGSDVFTNTESDTNGTKFIRHVKTSLAGNKMIDNKEDTLSHVYDSSALLMVAFIKTYFAGTNSAGDSSLYVRSDGINTELVRGITDLQFIYGKDTNGDIAVDTFEVANTSTMEQVRSIRVSIEAQSDSNISNGAPLTRTYTATANVRNKTI